MGPHRMVYVTAPSEDAALAIGRAVVGERLAACANVLPGMRSVYRWNGAVQEDGEAVLLLKTRVDRLEALFSRVRALHGYECPCIVAVPLTEGEPAYLAWIDASLDSDG